MAQIIQHKRGLLEDLSGVTPNKAELLVVTGSTIPALADGLVFVGNHNDITSVNKILTGSSSPNLSGYDSAVNGIPFYNTTDKNLQILREDGNIDIVLDHSKVDFGGSTILSGSLTAPNNNAITIAVAGGLTVSGDNDFTLNQGSDQTITIGVAGGIVSSSAQISGYNTFLEIGGDNVVSSSAQVSAYGVFAELNGDNLVSSSAQISSYGVFAELNGDGLVSSSAQVKSLLPAGTVSGSSQVTNISNSQIDASAAISHTKIDFGGSQITSGSLNFAISGSTGNDTVQIGVDALSIVGTSNEIETSVTNNTITIGLPSNVTIGNKLTVVGDLEVQGTTTTVDSTTITLGDNIIELNGSGAANGGLLVKDVTNPNTASGSLLWDSTNDYWKAGALGSESQILLASGMGIISASSQVNADSITNFDSNVKDKLNAEGVLSGSAQITAGSGIVSSSAQISSYGVFAELNGDNLVSSSAQVSAYGVFAELNGDNLVSSSAQISAYNTFLEINGDGVHSGSAQVVAALVNQDVDFGTGGISGSSLDITGNAKIDGNLVLGGNITIGDASSDTISFGGEISSDLIPSASNTYDLGSTTNKFAEVHATTIYGSISATNGVVSGSSQVFSDVSGDITIASNGVASIGSGVIVNADINASAAISHTKIDFGGSGLTSGSLGLAISGSTGNDTVQVGTDALSIVGTSNEITTAVTNNTITIGLPDDVTIGNNLVVTGNLTVNGDTVQTNVSTLNVEDNIIELNYGGSATSGGIYVKDATGGNTVSGSLLWDGTNDYWKAGALGSEARVIVGNGTDTAGTITKFSADGVITDSIITESGTTVTISDNLILGGLTASSFLVSNGSKQLTSVSTSTNGDILVSDGAGNFSATNTIDGGTF